MSTIAAQQIRAEHEQADGAGFGIMRQAARVGCHPFGQIGVIDADFGVIDRWHDFHLAAHVTALAIGITIHQRADHVDDIVVAARQPILQRQEIGAHVLRRAGDELQDFGQAAEHFHLPRARTCAWLRCAAHFFDERHQASGFGIHPVIADARQLHDFACRHQADHRVAILAPRAEGGHNRFDMIFKEQHRRQDDVATGNVSAAFVEAGGIAFPVCRGVEIDGDARPFADKLRRCALDRARKVIVERHNDDPDFRCEATVHNAPLRHRACRG